MSPLPSLAYAPVELQCATSIPLLRTCWLATLMSIMFPHTLNTPFIILHFQIFRIMEGVRVSSYVSVNSGNLHALSRFDCVRVCMHVCLSSSFCFFSSSSIAPAWRGSASPPSEREREKTRVWKRKDNAHTQRVGRRGRMNPHTSPMQLCWDNAMRTTGVINRMETRLSGISYARKIHETHTYSWTHHINHAALAHPSSSPSSPILYVVDTEA